MVWKIRDSFYLASSAEFAVEIIETSTIDGIKIQSSATSHEVVYDPEPNPLDSGDERKRLVRFSTYDEFFIIMNRQEITPEERKAMWFRKAELKKMRNRFENEESDDATTRDPPQNDQLIEALHQLMAISVVLDEQARQRREQICDPELIAQKYRAFVQRSRQSLFIANLARDVEHKNTQKGSLQMKLDSLDMIGNEQSCQVDSSTGIGAIDESSIPTNGYAATISKAVTKYSMLL